MFSRLEKSSIPGHRLQHPLAVNHRGDNDHILLHAVNDSVTVGEDLAEVFVVELGHILPRKGKVAKARVDVRILLTTVLA